jgi:hypothetical protein
VEGLRSRLSKQFTSVHKHLQFEFTKAIRLSTNPDRVAQVTNLQLLWDLVPDSSVAKAFSLSGRSITVEQKKTFCFRAAQVHDIWYYRTCAFNSDDRVDLSPFLLNCFRFPHGLNAHEVYAGFGFAILLADFIPGPKATPDTIVNPPSHHMIVTNVSNVFNNSDKGSQLQVNRPLTVDTTVAPAVPSYDALVKFFNDANGII